MPEWIAALINSPLAGGVVSGLLFLGGVKVEIRNLHEKSRAAIDTAKRAHERLDSHIDNHLKGI